MSTIKLTEITGKILADINDECLRHVELGYDVTHDDRHDLIDWRAHISRYGVKASDAAAGHDIPTARRRLVQVCALAFKALQAFDRHYPLMRKDAAPSRQVSSGPHICRNCAHVSIGEGVPGSIFCNWLTKATAVEGLCDDWKPRSDHE